MKAAVVLQQQRRSTTPAASEQIWDRVLLAKAGFSTDAEWLSEFGVRRDYRAIVWHDMEGFLPGAIAEWNKGKAGAHLAVLQNGEVVLTCPLEYVAWHAGTDNTPGSGKYGRTPFWRSHNVNPHSIGVEIEGFVTQPYTQAQAAAVRKIALWAKVKLSIVRVHTMDQIDGHHAHSEISSSRSDPGPNFDWTWVTG